MLTQVTLNDIEPIAIGAGILGTGGGGDPYIDTLHLRAVIHEHGPQTILAPADLPDDATAVIVGYMGAPTASIEKLPQGTELVQAVQLLEAHTGRKVDAIGIAEIGGGNSLGPIITGLQAGVPTLDADGMGRAFPELPMSTFLFNDELKPEPLAMVDAAANKVVLPQTASAQWGERIARTLTVCMGATAGVACMPMSGAQFKHYCIPHTLTLAWQLGKRVQAARKAGEDVPQVIADTLQGRVLLRGKISDVNRRTTKGFARGTVTIQGFGAERDELYIEFQNEFLIAYHNGEVVATVPDLICIVTEDEGQSVATELLRYGTRVAVLGVPGAPQLKTARALSVVGPRAFGYAVDFMPLAGGVIGV
jgi:DUF917 family protein